MSTSDSNQALQELLDKQAIHEVLMRYCRGIDRCDEELLRGVYHPDATDNHGLFVGKAADFIPWALEALKLDMSTSHCIANELIEVRGDVAYSEAYFMATHRRQLKDGTLSDLHFAGRYVDRLERRHGVWKIADRKVVMDRSRIDPVARTFDKGEPVLGLRSRQDASYQR